MVTPSGISIFLNALQPLNIDSDIISKFCGNSMEYKLTQFSKVFFEISVFFPANSTTLKFLQFEKAPTPIPDTSAGIVIFDNLLLAKHSSGISVIFSFNVTLSKLLLLKTPLLIDLYSKEL